ncbi:MAG: class II aldolase/adducin family protein [Acidimicrobiaceae bacterium]|nr:class II aldolase/adducin family protein [Acidimicrobiaceae bacterium]
MDTIRREIAICTRMLVDVGILEYSGHVSSRLPSGDAFLIQPVDDVRSDLGPSRLLVVGLDGQLIEGDGQPPSETSIHSEIYKARPDVNAVAHFHHDPTTMFSMVATRPLVPVKNHAVRWAHDIPIHPDTSHISSVEQGQELAKTLGASHAALLRGHGEVVVAESIKTLFADVIHFVENATALAHAVLLGEVVPLATDDLEKFQSTFNREKHSRKLWTYYSVTAANKGLIPVEWLFD